MKSNNVWFVFQFLSETTFSCHQQTECCHRIVSSGLFACGSGNVVLIIGFSLCGSLPSFLHYTMGPKTPKPTWPQPKHVGPLCAVRCLIPIRPTRRKVCCDVMGQFYITKVSLCEIKASSDRDEQLMIMNDHFPCSLTHWYCEGVWMVLHLQGQKWLINRTSFHKDWSDNLMWHNCVKMRET